MFHVCLQIFDTSWFQKDDSDVEKNNNTILPWDYLYYSSLQVFVCVGNLDVLY